jgi:hypothetical protein
MVGRDGGKGVPELTAFGQERLRPAAPDFGTTTLVYQRLSPMDFNKLSSGPGSRERSFVTFYQPEFATFLSKALGLYWGGD